MITQRRLILTIFVVAAMLASAGATIYADDTVKPTGDNVIVNLEARNVSVQNAIEQMFKGTGLSYQIQPGVAGTVIELRLHGVTLNQALKAISDEAGLTVTFESGVYVISVPSEVLLGRGPQQTAPEETAELAPLPEVAPDSVGGTTDQGQVASTDQSATGTTGETGPVYYGQPGTVAYPYGYSGPPPAFQYGQVTVLGGYTPIVLGQAHPPMITTASSPAPFATSAPLQPSFPTPYLPFPITAPVGW